LVVWRDDRGGGEQIFGAMLGNEAPDCSATGFAISQTAGAQPAVAFADDGHGFLVTWYGSPDGGASDIYGAWVTTECTVRDIPGVLLAAGEGDELAPQLTAGLQGKMLLAYSRDAPLPVGNERLEVRAIDSGALDGEPCSEDGECASRSCTDGVCCRDQCGVCERCDAEGGTCALVISAPDDSCQGSDMCDAAGTCKLAHGESCEDGARCASGFCVEGVCCDSACDGACDRCAVSGGVCTTLDCSPYTCTPEKICLARCETSVDCADGYRCLADGRCEPADRLPPPSGCTCTLGSRGASGGAAAWLFALLMVLRRRQNS
jgi:hypothetical protein